MAQRLIDANELLERSWRWPINSRQAVQQMIKGCPTIEAEPVKHGKWIACTSSEHWKCSECGCRAGYWFNEENSGIDSWERDFSEWLSDYCPNCGCRMDEE